MQDRALNGPLISRWRASDRLTGGGHRITPDLHSAEVRLRGVCQDSTWSFAVQKRKRSPPSREVGSSAGHPDSEVTKRTKFALMSQAGCYSQTRGRVNRVTTALATLTAQNPSLRCASFAAHSLVFVASAASVSWFAASSSATVTMLPFGRRLRVCGTKPKASHGTPRRTLCAP
jgi:hypothetical protein